MLIFLLMQIFAGYEQAIVKKTGFIEVPYIADILISRWNGKRTAEQIDRPRRICQQRL